MKYVVIVGDGMADEPLEELAGKTPLALAKMSHIDTLARISEIGMVHTIPKGLKTDFDVANLSILGYDPKSCYKKTEDSEEYTIELEDFYTKTGKKGAVITDCEYLADIASKAGMSVISAVKNPGESNSEYTSKKDAAVKALFEEDNDFVYIHVQTPDEMSLAGSVEKKIKAIESIDAYIVGPLVEEIQGRDAEFRLLVMPDHPTLVRIKERSSDAVPYMLFDSALEVDSNTVYTEKTARETDNFFDEGYLLLNHFLELD